MDHTTHNLEEGYRKVDGTVGIFISDLSGFTKTVRAKGITHYASLILLNRTILGQALKKYGAIHVFYEADNVWAILPSGKAATLAALEGSRLVQLYNSTQDDPHKKINLSGVGVDEGDNVYISKDDGKFYGKVVSRAFKIGEDMVSNGEVCVADSLWPSLASDPDFSSITSELDEQIKESDNICYYHLKGTVNYKCESLDAWTPAGTIEDKLIQRLMPGADVEVLDAEIKSQYLLKHYVVMFGHELPITSTEAFLDRFHQLFSITSPIIKNFNGTSVEHCFAIFDCPSDALNACFRIREQVAAYNASVSAELQLTLKGFGIHSGDLLWLPQTTVHWGDPVNTASKLGEDLAEDGEIILSDAVFTILKHLLPANQGVNKDLEASGVTFHCYSIPATDNLSDRNVPSSGGYVLHYWPVKARGYLPYLIAKVGNVGCIWPKDVEWPEMKASTPFGQLPVLTGPDGFMMGQSLAIVHFIGHEANLLGESKAEYARSEELIQEFEDLLVAMGKAHYNPERTKAFDEFFAHTSIPNLKVFETHKDCLAKLLGDQKTFSKGKLLAGDLAVWAAFDIVVALQPDALDSHPTLKAFFEHVGANPQVKAAGEGLQMYYKRQSD